MVVLALLETALLLDWLASGAGAGDAFFAGIAIGQTYGKSLMESCEIGSRLASAVITVSENTCPRFLPEELGLDPKC